VKIDVGGAVFPAHRIILAESSPVFSTMLDVGMSESRDGVIKVHGFGVETVEEFLRFLYTGSSNSLADENYDGDAVMELLKIAHQYLVAPLLERCTQVLAQKMNKENAQMIFQLGETYSVPRLVAASSNFLLNNPKI